jgi:hypothetical protein
MRAGGAAEGFWKMGGSEGREVGGGIVSSDMVMLLLVVRWCFRREVDEVRLS